GRGGSEETPRRRRGAKAAQRPWRVLMGTSSPIAERHPRAGSTLSPYVGGTAPTRLSTPISARPQRLRASAASLFSTLPPRRPPLLARQEGRNEEPGLPAFLLSLEVLLFRSPRSAQ